MIAGFRRILAALLAGAVVAGIAPVERSSALQTSGRNILMYYVPYDSYSWDSFVTNASQIDYIAPQWVTIDACGQIGASDNQTLKQYAKEHGVRMLPTLVTFTAWQNHRVLTDPAASATAIAQITDYVVSEQYDGFDLDLEGIDAGDREAYTRFVARLAESLHAQGKLLTLAVPAKTRDITTGWSGAYDYAQLGQYADLIMIMTYEFSGAWGQAGPVAPYDWVEQVMRYGASQIPPNKLLLGLAFYGYVWNATSGGARALDFDDAYALALQHQSTIDIDPETRSATFRFQTPDGVIPRGRQISSPAGHEITERKPGPCAVATPAPGPSTGGTAKRPVPGVTQEHVVWIEEARSAAARLNLVGKYGLAGVGAWRLGQEDSAVWPLLDSWRNGS